MSSWSRTARSTCVPFLTPMFGIGLAAMAAARAQTPPRPPTLLEKPPARSDAQVPSAVTGQPPRLKATPLPAADAGTGISLTCPPNAAPAAMSTDVRSSGWLIRASWAPIVEVRVVDPASVNAGAVVECVYGYTKGSIGGSMPLFVLSRSVGPGVTASACLVKGETVTCGSSTTLRCPPRLAHMGTDRVRGTDWTFETGWPSGFMQASVADPPSSGAGAVVDCAYGPIDVTIAPMVVAFTLRRNLGAGIEARMCSVDQAARTVTCKR